MARSKKPAKKRLTKRKLAMRLAGAWYHGRGDAIQAFIDVADEVRKLAREGKL